MTLLPWCIGSAVCAGIPAVLTLANLAAYRVPRSGKGPWRTVTVVIPARNEAHGIQDCVRSALDSRVPVNVQVVDDHSTDGTAERVLELAEADARVRLLRSAPLPPGWNGKQHACWQGAQMASTETLLFLDADVRLEPDAVGAALAWMQEENADLVSGFPREVTGTFLEKLLLPLIHFVLLGLLPMVGLRKTRWPAFAAGCGQFVMVTRAAYQTCGGHAAIRDTMHDGLRLPRLLREHGFATALADLTPLATCRMYTGAAATWNGLEKNATEGLGAPARIVPMTLLLGLGQVAPAGLLVAAWTRTFFVIPFLGPPIRVGMTPVWWAVAALVLSYLPRVCNAVRFRQSWLSVVLHPLGMLTLLALQWWALLGRMTGRQRQWKSRSYRVG